MGENEDAGSVVQDIRLMTRKKHPAEEKIRIVSDGLEGETGTAEPCRRQGTNRKDHGI